jgi:DNA-binding beta-propeller fold protein YncE
MSLECIGYVELPDHANDGGFDHAAVHQSSGKLYVAHTANDAIDVIDSRTDQYCYSIPNLTGVAGALVSDEHDLIFSSNRAENTIGIFSPDNDRQIDKIAVGMRPNGLSFDPKRNLLLAANVGDPAVPGSHTVSMIDVKERKRLLDIPVPGRTRWTVFDEQTDTFFVNIADPAVIVTIDAAQPTQISRVFEIPASGPHGLDLDVANRRLYCACDGKKLISLDIHSGAILSTADLSGIPDVIFFNAAYQDLYVAIGDPGLIDVFDTRTMALLETIVTEKGAHTIAFAPTSNKVYAFLPLTHRAAVYVDGST